MTGDRSHVQDGRVARIGGPAAVPTLDAPAGESMYNRLHVTGSTALRSGQVARIDDLPAVDTEAMIRTLRGGSQPVAAPSAEPELRPDDLPIPGQIIALLGHDGVGKSTLARALQAVYGGEVLPFSEALRLSLVASGLPRDYVYGKPTPPELRELLRAYANAQAAVNGVNYYPDQWQRAASQSGAPLLIVDDLRRPSQLSMLIRRGAIVLDLVRHEVEPDPFDADPPGVVKAVRDSRAALQALVIRQDPWAVSRFRGILLDTAVPTPDAARDYLNGLGLTDWLADLLPPADEAANAG